MTQDQSDGSVLGYGDISCSAVHYDSDSYPSRHEIVTHKEDRGAAAVSLDLMDVWDLGLYLYGISYTDTNRTLRLITYEGYGYSPLSYYVACCCWVRATEGYWGYGNLYSAFGEADTSYDTWMDGLGIADFAYVALEQCYRDPEYIRYCNGMTVPWDWIYYEDGIYVWN